MAHLLTDANALLGQSLGTCIIRHLIGRGGMGAVYLAQQTRPRREVAVKVLIPGLRVDQQSRIDFLARFRREADAIAALDHINIIPIYEYGEQEQVAHLVMPYVTGGSLHQVLEKRGALPLCEVLPVLEQAAAALDYAHAKGIIHRDLKPGNILFHSDGRVLLADFGLAKVIWEEAEQNGANALTSAGTIIGTPEYLSPEQAAGQTLDQRTDIYSLGIVLFHMLTGRVPFRGATPVSTAIQHAFSEPLSLFQLNPTLSPAIDAVVMKALAKKPEQRYERAGQLAQALSAAAGIFSAQVSRADHREASNILTPLLLTSEDTLPKTLIRSSHEADTVVDTLKKGDGHTSLARGRQFRSPPVQHSAAPKQRAGRLSWQVMILGVMLILFLVASGSLAYLYVTLKEPSAALVSLKKPSPVSTATLPAHMILPAPQIPVGKLLYGTLLPGYPCDSAGGSWSMIATVRVTCSTSATELANTNPHHLAGVFLNALPSGHLIPNDYILQVQIREGPRSHGACEIFFRNQPGSINVGAYSFSLSPTNNWAANAYDDITHTKTQLYTHRTTVRLHGVVTIDIHVQKETFILSINGREQGEAISSRYPSGTVGLVVDTGADVFFSNFALYALPNNIITPIHSPKRHR